jgi:acyl-coenzyme A thioesterase PaaI-like protein
MTDSRLARRLGQLDRAPAFLRPWLRDRVLGRAVPLVGTARLHFERIGPDGVVISIANRRSVQNHIGGVHAAAMALLAETATGFCLGWHLPDDRLPLIKSLQVEFQHPRRPARAGEPDARPDRPDHQRAQGRVGGPRGRARCLRRAAYPLHHAVGLGTPKSLNGSPQVAALVPIEA